MSLHRLSSRLAKLEAKLSTETAPPYVTPEPDDAWWAGFLSFVWEYRHWFSEDESPPNHSDVVVSLLAHLRYSAQHCTAEALHGLHPGMVRLLQEVRQCCADEFQGPFVEETPADVASHDTSHSCPHKSP